MIKPSITETVIQVNLDMTDSMGPGKLVRHMQVNLDMTDSMGPEKLVRHMQNPSYTYDEYLICIGLGPSISSVICKNPSYSCPSYPSSPIMISRILGWCRCERKIFPEFSGTDNSFFKLSETDYLFSFI